MPDPSLPFDSITTLAAKIRAGTLSPVSLTEALLERIAALDGRLHAFIAVTRERALAEARAAELALRGGQDLGPLHGIPYAAKDLFDVRGVATTAGTRLLAGNVAREDAAVVRRLAGAGMVLVGKTYTVQFAFGGVGINHDQGTPHNPWHATPHAPGGSSSGSAVAVAAGLVPMALGSDTGGSVRLPAALCGTVGLKTTVGRVSRAGVYPLCWTLDSVGPLDPDGGGRRPRLSGDPGRRRPRRDDRRHPAARRARPARRRRARASAGPARDPLLRRGRPRGRARGARDRRRVPVPRRPCREHRGAGGGGGDVRAEARLRHRGRGLRLQRPVPRRALRRARSGGRPPDDRRAAALRPGLLRAHAPVGGAPSPAGRAARRRGRAPGPRDAHGRGAAGRDRPDPRVVRASGTAATCGTRRWGTS